MTDWHQSAACADGVDPDLFFPEVPGLAGNKAKAVCQACPVREECLDYALRHPVLGIWGGTTEPQRVNMRKALGITLPSGWRARRSAWQRRYYEMRELGYDDLEIAWRWNVKPTSLVRQMNRHNLTPSERLLAEANREKRMSA